MILVIPHYKVTFSRRSPHPCPPELTATSPRAATTVQFTPVFLNLGQWSTPWRLLENAGGAQSHLYVESETVQLTEAEGRRVDARVWGGGNEMLLKGYEVSVIEDK